MELEAIIQKAIEIGQHTGFVSFDQINDLCPKETAPDHIESLFAALRDAGMQVTDDAVPSPSLVCSFCGKAQVDVVQLIAGATGFICNECVRLCVQIIANKQPEWLREHVDFVQSLVERNR
ncbi:ClpX C4-type zinc finger protein [Bradyrhizobium sp. STM 3557]|uniref:RNA polymerase sigma factor region1.1 domain-containing protein n=1 Tax=Bradyrhizobium sp. STM 3557 TaxID=578920 RepID=UPI00388F15EB